MSKICKKRVHGNDKKNLPWDLAKWFAKKFEFCNKDINTFLRYWEKEFIFFMSIDKRFNEISLSLPERKTFYSNLNIEDTADSGFKRIWYIWKNFTKNVLKHTT